MPQQTRSFSSVCVCLLLMAAACHAAPTTPRPDEGIRRRLVDKRPVEGNAGLESQLWLIEYPPGASAPVHHHPVVGIGYVLEGEFESAFAGEAPAHVRAGESFVDQARTEHSLFRNTSPDRWLRFVISYAIPSGWPTVEFGTLGDVQLRSDAGALTIAQPALYPETLEVDPHSEQFLVGSVREGAVYAVGADGAPRKLIDDERLISVLGIAIDRGSKRLFATNSDLGAGRKRSSRGPRKEAGVGIYDLTSGRALQYVDLAALAPEADHLINGIAVDARGNAYVTDSFSATIYKIDLEGRASLFLQSDEFKGQGINLNGIVAHPGGYLLAVKKSTGALYRIPLDDPRAFGRVDIATSFIGGDGLTLLGDDRLLLVANQTPGAASNSLFVLDTRDGWKSAGVSDTRALGAVYPTTSVVRGNKIYVLSSHLDEWIGASDDATRDAIAQRERRAEIQEVGSILR